jgi:hypothetical protein
MLFIVRMTRMTHRHTQLCPLRWGLVNIFPWVWPGTTSLVKSASHIAAMIDASHWAQLLVDIGSCELSVCDGLEL